MAYEVTTPVFEGPFDLLLHLILSEQVDLYEISLTRIVDAYLHELQSMERCNLEVATEFLLIAATLIELKTRRLLPGSDDMDLDEELALWSERDLLLTRLVECKTFKDTAVALERLAQEAGRSFPRLAGPDERFVDLDQATAFGDIQIVWLGRDRMELEELAGVDAYDG
jgi:segregation and condensation protein A